MKTANGTIRRIAAILACAVAANVASAVDWYVDDANGDNGNDGRSAATAKKTIQAAVDRAAAPFVVIGVARRVSRSDMPSRTPGPPSDSSEIVIVQGEEVDAAFFAGRNPEPRDIRIHCPRTVAGGSVDENMLETV